MISIQIVLAILGITIGAIVAIALAITYIISRIRQQDMTILRQTNDDLRINIEDKGKEIRDLLVTQESQKMEIDSLNDRVKVLENSNKTLEHIFKDALKSYFEAHPEIAKKSMKL